MSGSPGGSSPTSPGSGGRPGPEADPVLRQRARVARLCGLARRGGYSLFALAVVAFAAGIANGLTSTVERVTVGALAAGSVLLAPAIVFGYAAKAADREDRERAEAEAAKRQRS